MEWQRNPKAMRLSRLVEHSTRYVFSVLEHPETPILKLHAQLVEKIKQGLTIRYIKSSDFGFSQARLYINGSALNGRIEEREDSTPIVVVDGIEYTWEEFGHCLTNQ